MLLPALYGVGIYATGVLFVLRYFYKKRREVRGVASVGKMKEMMAFV